MDLLSTIRFTLRQMRKRWVLTTAAALSLALCLGLNSAVFSVFNSVLLRPLPFPEPERVVEIYNSYPDGGLDKGSSNIELYTVYKEQVPALSGLALSGFQSLTFGSEEGAQRILALRLSVDGLETLGLAPAIGQPFAETHGITGTDNAVLLTDAFWKTAFAGDPGIVGQLIELDGRQCEVLGILPESFRRFNADADVVVPFAWNPSEVDLSNRHLNYAMLLGRIANGSSIAEAQAQVDAADAAYRESNPEVVPFLDRSGHRSYVRMHQEERVASIRSTLYLLNAFALAILVIGALNIANLRFAEMANRERELVIRRVMGASKRQLILQMLMEAGVLVVIGGLLGLVTAYLSLDLIRNSFSGLVRDVDAIRLDASVFGWAGLLIIVTVLIIGLTPYRLLGKLNFQSLLMKSGRASAGGGGARLRSVIGILQTALAVILLVATGLFARSFWSATRVEPGFQTEHLHTFRISMPETRYPEATDRVALVDRILDRLRGLPGVEQAAGASSVPIVTGMALLTFAQFGDDPASQGAQKAADNFYVTEDFFTTMGIPLLEGRPIERSDLADASVAFVTDATMVDRFLGDNPLSQRMAFGRPPEESEPWPTVVGTVPRIINRELTDLNQAPLVYRSYYQNPTGSISFLLRSNRAHEDLLADVRTIIADLDAQMPIYLTGELRELIENSLNDRRAIMGLTTLFALVAVLLAVAGIYGIQAYLVQVNRRDTAIRAAVGATPGVLLKHIITRGLIPVSIGLIGGLGTTLLLAPYVENMVYAVQVRDPLTIGVVFVLILGLSTLAVAIPARRASRIHPARMLHEE